MEKTSPQTVTSSTTLVNDTQLAITVSAGAAYWFELYLFYDGGTSGSSDLKLAWTFPSGMSMGYQCISRNNSGQTAQIQTDVIVAQTNGAGVPMALTMRGTVNVSSTTGTLQLQWAQNASSATATTVHTGSALMLNRIT